MSAGAGSARPGSVRVGLCVGFCVRPPGGVVFVRGGPGMLQVPALLPWGFTGFTRPESLRAEPNLYPIQPSTVPGKRAQGNLPFLRLPGHIPKAGSSPEKETGFGYLIAGAEFVLL